MAQNLTNIARDRSVAVVLINQMTTAYQNGEPYLVAALGENWSHAATNRVLLSWEDGYRCASLQKSPNRPFGTVRYNVTQAGIR
ncbi:DNA repair protein [Planoprotostelium fungivorum]|nr:DNA repair protein [Planoprotostelium fungivorum]